MFEDEKCPMKIKTCEKYNITDKEVQKFCDKGCCPICGRLLKEYLEKTRGIKIDEA